MLLASAFTTAENLHPPADANNTAGAEGAGVQAAHPHPNPNPPSWARDCYKVVFRLFYILCSFTGQFTVKPTKQCNCKNVMKVIIISWTTITTVIFLIINILSGRCMVLLLHGVHTSTMVTSVSYKKISLIGTKYFK